MADKIDVWFRTNDGIHFICAEHGGGQEGAMVNGQPAGLAVANRTAAAGWESFLVRPGAEAGTIGIFMPGGRSEHNPTGAWLSAQQDGTLVFNRQRPEDFVPEAWEAFQVVPTGAPNQYALRTAHGTFVVAEGNGGGDLRHRVPGTDDQMPGPWEFFITSEPLAGGGIPSGNWRQSQGHIRRFHGFAVGDDNGPRNYVGLSRFYWTGELGRDAGRVEREMDNDVQAGYGYARVMFQVESMGSSNYWAGCDSKDDATIQERVRRTLDLARERKFTILGTLIGKGGQMGSQAHRMNFVRRMAEVCKDYPDVILTAEMMNEPGAGGNINYAEIKDLDRAFNQIAPGILTGTGADWGAHATDPTPETYAQSQTEVGFVHLPRDVNLSEMQDRPWRQPWDINLWGKPWVNNEPIGPYSSVASETRPLVLRSHALVTFLSRGFAYCYHSDAGIRGHWDMNGSPGYRENPTAVRFLPDDICSGRPQNANSSYPERHWDVDVNELRQVNGNRRGFVRVYGQKLGATQWSVAFGPITNFTMSTTRAVRVTCYQQDVNEQLWERDLGAGERLTLGPDHVDYLLKSTEI